MLTRLASQPIALLLFTGSLFGMTFPLGKLAGAAGVPPLLWVMVISAGAVLFLGPNLWLRGDLRLPRGKALPYVLISGLMSFALVNALILFLMPILGAGQVGLMFALSPVATLALSVAFGIKGTGRLGMIGIGFGLLGAAMVAIGKSGLGAISGFALVGLSLPLILAMGNVYRTLYWPEGAHVATLAFWSHLAALVAVALVQVTSFGSLSLAPLFGVPLVTGLQLVAAAFTFPAYFKLQQVGGPVLLSQIGYVAAAIALISGTAFLGEVYSLQTWAGAGIILLGISLTILAQSSVSLRLKRV